MLGKRDASASTQGPGGAGATPIIVVSNRLPVALRRVEGRWQGRPSSGGLVQALSPVIHRGGGVWVGWPGFSDEGGGSWRQVLKKSAGKLGYELVPLLLSRREVSDFYYGFANSILWPLFHDLLGECNFDPAFWEVYLGVNRKYAGAVAACHDPRALVWVQDYQLIHVGQFLRELGEQRRLGFFLHTPFPSPDIFSRLPWRAEILEALLAYDLVGFQTYRDRRNFLACVAKLLPDARIGGRGQRAEVRMRGGRIRVGSFPIGIDFERFAAAARSDEVEEKERQLSKGFGPVAVVLGVDRLDYTKGIPHRLLAFGKALETWEELQGRVILFQIVVPSRDQVPEYQALRRHIERLVGEINGRFATPGWVPVHYRYRVVARSTLIALYRMAEVGLVTSLKDGMNLVAKEYCACQVARPGTLVLSEFAGAAAQLGEGSILVNPYDVEGTAAALWRALHSPPAERQSRMARLQQVCRRQDVFWWCDRFLGTASSGPGDMGSGEADYASWLVVCR